MSLAVLDLYRCCIILVSKFNWPCYVLLTSKWRTLHLTHQKLSQMHAFLWRTIVSKQVSKVFFGQYFCLE